MHFHPNHIFMFHCLVQGGFSSASAQSWQWDRLMQWAVWGRRHPIARIKVLLQRDRKSMLCNVWESSDLHGSEMGRKMSLWLWGLGWGSGGLVQISAASFPCECQKDPCSLLDIKNSENLTRNHLPPLAPKYSESWVFSSPGASMPVDKIGLIVVSCFVDETKTVGGGAAQAVLHSVDAIMRENVLYLELCPGDVHEQLI